MHGIRLQFITPGDKIDGAIPDDIVFHMHGLSIRHEREL